MNPRNSRNHIRELVGEEPTSGCHLQGAPDGLHCLCGKACGEGGVCESLRTLPEDEFLPARAGCLTAPPGGGFEEDPHWPDGREHHFRFRLFDFSQH